MGCFLSLPVYESSVDECPAEAIELIALASGDWTPVSAVEVILETRQILSSLFLLHSLQKLKSFWIFHWSSGFQMLFMSGFFCLDHFQYLHISSEYIHTSYSLFILQYLLRIHLESLWHLRKSEDFFFVFLLLISQEVFWNFVSQLHQLDHCLGTKPSVCFGCVVRLSSDKDALWKELSHPYTGSLKESILWVQNNCTEGTFSSATAV